MSNNSLQLDEPRRQLRELRRQRIDEPFPDFAERALEIGANALGFDTGLVTRIDEAHNYWEVLASTDPADGYVPRGRVLDLESTYCRRLLDRTDPLVVSDAPAEGWADDRAYQTHERRCYWGTKITIDDAEGTVCFLATEPREEPFSSAELLLAEFVALTIETELRRRAGDLERAHRTDFTRVLSRGLRHSLRNRAAAIRGWLEQAADGSPGAHEQATAGVDDLIELSETVHRFETVLESAYERRPIDLPATLEGIVTDVEGTVSGASVTVDVQEPIAITARPTVELALEELISNAANHAGAQPTVTVTVAGSDANDRATITVSDDGPGLSDSAQAVLTEGADAPLAHGRGFGLWLVYWIITGHGGTVDLSVDDGTTVTVSLPRTATDTDVIDGAADRKRLQQSRDRFKTVFEEAREAMVIVDGEGRFIECNGAGVDLFGRPRETLLGRPLEAFVPAAANGRDEAGVDSDGGTATIERPDGTRVQADYSVTPEIIPDQDLWILRDVTDRNRLEMELQEVLARVTDGSYALDTDWRFTHVNRRAAELIDVDSAVGEENPGEGLLGKRIWEVLEWAADSRLREEYEAAMASQESTSFELHVPELETWFETNAYPSETGLSVYFRDISDRKERERMLRELYEIIADTELSFEEKVDSLLAVGQNAIGTDFASFSHADGEEYRFESVRTPGGEIEPGDVVPLDSTICERSINTEQTLVFGDLEADAPDLAARDAVEELGLSCYLGAPVYRIDDVYGTFCFYDTESRSESFSEWEVALVDLLSQLVTYELERERREEQLRTQRKQLATHNRFQGTIRAISLTAAEATSREAIERQVCEQLASIDPFDFAWIGRADHGTLRATAAADAGTGLLNPDERKREGATAGSPIDGGSAGRALRTGELQVTSDLETGASASDLEGDSADEPWRAYARSRSYRSSAAVPITHEGVTYGVLTVYAAETAAFSGVEGEILAQLGELIGHAIYAVEQRRALQSDSVTELEFQVSDHPLLAVAFPETEVTFERWIPGNDGHYYQFVTVRGLDQETFEGAITARPSVVGLNPISVREDELRYELTLEPTRLVEVLGSYGGRLEEAVLANGVFRLVVEVPAGTDAREVFDAVEEVYSTVEFRAQRTVEREGSDWGRLHGVVTDTLTDKQRTALETAYSAGYYDIPRTSSSQDVAEILEVSRPTFSEHLRVAESKLLDGVFGDRSERRG